MEPQGLIKRDPALTEAATYLALVSAAFSVGGASERERRQWTDKACGDSEVSQTGVALQLTCVVKLLKYEPTKTMALLVSGTPIPDAPSA